MWEKACGFSLQHEGFNREAVFFRWEPVLYAGSSERYLSFNLNSKAFLWTRCYETGCVLHGNHLVNIYSLMMVVLWLQPWQTFNMFKCHPQPQNVLKKLGKAIFCSRLNSLCPLSMFLIQYTTEKQDLL